MKRLFGLLMALSIVVGVFLGGLGLSSAALAEDIYNSVDAQLQTEYGSKLDLNNANVQAFRKYPGMYPTLARKVLLNAPFSSVEEVLKLPGLSERQLDILKSNLDNFTVTDPNPALVEGADRFNNGVYK